MLTDRKIGLRSTARRQEKPLPFDLQVHTPQPHKRYVNGRWQAPSIGQYQHGAEAYWMRQFTHSTTAELRDCIKAGDCDLYEDGHPYRKGVDIFDALGFARAANICNPDRNYTVVKTSHV